MLKNDDHEYNTNTAGFFAAPPYEGVKFNTTRELIEQGKRGVFKIGSALIANVKKGQIRLEWMKSMAADIAKLTKLGKLPIIVSSGSVAVARVNLGKTDKPKALEDKQALASVGNIELFKIWQKCFLDYGLTCGMLLISYADLQDKNSRYNLKLTVENMLRHGIVPILNENDCVSTYELCFGDNDTLSARIASLFNADYLVLLSDIKSLYDKDPNKFTDAKPIRIVDELTNKIMGMGGNPSSTEGTGGMHTKLLAAKIALSAGCHMIITNGTNQPPIFTLIKSDDAKTDIKKRRELDEISDNEIKPGPNGLECTHTLFIPEFTPLQTHIYRLKQDLAKTPKCALIIAKGSFKKLNKREFLFPDDLIDVEGEFKRGDAVLVKEDGNVFAVCRTVHAAKDLRRIIAEIEGKRTEEEVAKVLGYGGRFSIVNPSFAYPYDEVIKAEGPSTPESDSENDSKET